MDLPMISVVMPVRNEGAFMATSLGAVLAQDYPPDRMEVIVADGMSSDGTRATIRSLQQKHPNLRLIDNKGRIVPTGMNAALAHARGEVVIRIDGHCDIAKDYFRRCVEHLQRDGIDGVGGPLETVGETRLARVIAVAMSSPFGVGGSPFRTISNKTMLVDTVAFPAYKRSVIDRAGPYDEELVRNQDDEYNYRLRKMGAKLLLASDVRSRYYSRGTLGSLWRQYFQYGYWKVRVLQKHPMQMRPRQFAPITLVAALLVSLALALYIPAAWSLFLACAGGYAAANLAASVATARKSDWRMVALLPAAFATLHLSYGLGFLVGLARFWRRWGDHETRASFIEPPLPADSVQLEGAGPLLDCITEAIPDETGAMA